MKVLAFQIRLADLPQKLNFFNGLLHGHRSKGKPANPARNIIGLCNNPVIRIICWCLALKGRGIRDCAIRCHLVVYLTLSHNLPPLPPCLQSVVHDILGSWQQLLR